jgi:hypothetical protein
LQLKQWKGYRTIISLEDRFREIKAKAIAPSEKRRG